MTIFIALADVIDNPDVRATLERAFSTVLVATAREHAVTELTALGDAVDAAIIGVRERIDAGVLVALPRLRVVGSLGAGTDHLDLVALADRGVHVITTPGVNAVSVAEHALMMILALAKRARGDLRQVQHRQCPSAAHPANPWAGGRPAAAPAATRRASGQRGRKEIIDSDGLRAVVAERPDLRFAVDDFGLAEDGTAAVVGDRGLWSPHVAGITVEASAAMDDAVVRGVVQAVGTTC